MQCSSSSDLKLTKKNKGWDVYWKFQYGYKPMMAGNDLPWTDSQQT